MEVENSVFSKMYENNFFSMIVCTFSVNLPRVFIITVNKLLFEKTLKRAQATAPR